jgi:hypothetical protein
MVLCCAWLVYPIWCPEIGTNTISLAQLSRFYLKTETESSLQNVVFLNKNRMVDNVQKHNICNGISTRIFQLMSTLWYRAVVSQDLFIVTTF